MSFDSLVQQINELAETQRDRGTYFEYLARAYFQKELVFLNYLICTLVFYSNNITNKNDRLFCLRSSLTRK